MTASSAAPTRDPDDLTADRATAYAEAVGAGEIIAGPYVRGACRRHLDDLERGHERGLAFDPVAAQIAIDFFEQILKLSEGEFEGLPFVLEPSQAFIIGSIFGWKRYDEESGEWRRRFNKAFVEEGKGNGKSPLAAGIGILGLCADGEAGAQVYAAASKKDQAYVLFADAVSMVKAAPSLTKRLRLDGAEGKEYNISHLPSGSFFRPVSRDTGRTGSGPRPYFVLADEIHELPDRQILQTLRRGFKGRRQPLLFMITNSGSDRNSVAWEEHLHAIRVALGHAEAATDPTYVGEPIDDSTFSYVCALDEGDKPLEDPSCWVKANPLLGVTIKNAYIAQVVQEAKDIPGNANGILRLNFCIWTDADKAWMTRAMIEPLLADFDPVAEHRGRPVFMGLDLSRNRDITAMAAVVQTGTKEVPVETDGVVEMVTKPTYDAWTETWTPGDTMHSRALQDGIDYPTWAAEGQIHAPAGKMISYRHVAQTLAKYDRDYEIQLLAYDSYAFKRFEEDVSDLGLIVNFIEHPQGGKKRGKPREGMKEGLWAPGSLGVLEEVILEGRIRLRRNKVLTSALASAVKVAVGHDNYALDKERSLNKIDAAVALYMAVGAAHSREPVRTSVYRKRGIIRV